jgi:hypothetical protein
MAAGLTPNVVAVDPDLDSAVRGVGRRLLVGVTGVLGLGGGWVLTRMLVRGDPLTPATAVAAVLAAVLASVAIGFEHGGWRVAAAPADQGPGCTLLPARRAPRAATAAVLLAPAALLVLLGSAWSLLALGVVSAPLWRLATTDPRLRLDQGGIQGRRWWCGAARRIRWEDIASVSVTRSLRPQLLVHTRTGEPPLPVDVLLQRWSPAAIAAAISHFAARPRERGALTDARSVDGVWGD